MKYKNISVFKQEESNPFIDDLVEVKVSKRNIVAGKTSHVLIDEETGEMVGNAAIMNIRKYDPTQFIKFYTGKISLVFELSKRAQSVFSYIIENTIPNKDFVYVDIEDCMKETGYKSRATVISGLSELIEKKFIARSSSQVKYFINPTIFFNGNRVSFIETAVKDTEKNYKIGSSRD